MKEREREREKEGHKRDGEIIIDPVENKSVTNISVQKISIS